MNCTIRVAKTKALISFAVTVKLICTFVFPYTDCWFSHVAAQLDQEDQVISQEVYMHRRTAMLNFPRKLNNNFDILESP